MANMTSNTQGAEPREPRNGGQGTQQAGGSQQTGGSAQGTVAKATDLAAGLATKQVQKTRERFDNQVTQQRDQITGRVRTLSRALRGAGQMLEDDDVVAQALHYASEKVEGVAGYVGELNPTRAVEDLRGVARRQPLWFFGGAFVLGMALGRFARATGEGSEGAAGSGGVALERRPSGSARSPRNRAANPGEQWP